MSDYIGSPKWSAARLLLSAVGLCVGAALVGCSESGEESGRNYQAVPDTDWIVHGSNSEETRFSRLAQISTSNVGSLGLAWSLDLPEENALEATPLAIRGVLYFSGGFGKVYAVRARDGKLLWSYDPKVGEYAPSRIRVNFSVNRGVAYFEGRILNATKDGRMIALDARNGRPIWSTQFLRPNDGAISTGAPRIMGDKVIIGNSGAEMSVRGYVTALDARTGKILWRFFTVPGNPAIDRDETTRIAAKTWAGQWWKYGGGGTPWSGITYDEKKQLVYVGTGNGGPWNQEYRCPNNEDNLFLSSVVALDANTGAYKWHYQYNPCEIWDWKATSDIVLARLKIEGRTRDVLMQAPSNGFFYVIDRDNGKLISAEKLGKVNWADRIDLETGRPVENPEARYGYKPAIVYPSAYGAHGWQPTSYNPLTGLIYIPYMQYGMRISRNDGSDLHDSSNVQTTRIGANVEGYLDPKDPMDGRGSLIAWDPVKRSARWRVDYPTGWNTGTTTTAGNLVFQGTNAGTFYAYDARDGRRLWAFDARLGIIAPPITYAVGGKQYVSILVGPGGTTGENTLPEFAQGWKYRAQPRRILTFVLNGKARLPDTPPPDKSVLSLERPAMALDPGRVGRGMSLYHRACYSCHGAGAASSGGAPDLRESGIASDDSAFAQLLRSGALVEFGMPKFDDLSDPQINDLYQYIASEAQNHGTDRGH